MNPLIVAEIQNVGLQLHSLLQEVDPGKWTDETAESAQTKLRTLHALLTTMVPSELGAFADLTHGLMRPVTSSLNDGTSEPAAKWQVFRNAAMPVYGELSHALRAHGVQLPMLRPTNYLRNLQHGGAALLILVLLHYVLPTASWRVGIAGAAFGGAVFLEVGRYLFPPFNRLLMSVLGRIAHPHEAHRVNSSSWFISALFVLSFFDVVYGTLGVAILGAADPAAAVIGRRFGRRELVNGRTLEGTLTFWIVGTAVCGVCLALWFDYGLAHGFVMAATASAFAAAAELFSRRIDDNLSIPVAAAVGLWLVL